MDQKPNFQFYPSPLDAPPLFTAAPEHVPPPSFSAPSPDMADAVTEVERIIRYNFINKKLLEEALTHSSSFTADMPSPSGSYQRLEFVGDAALGLALSNFVFLAYPDVDPGQLSVIRAANISTEKLARVAVRHGFYWYVRRNSPALDDKVREFAKAVMEEDEVVVYGGAVKAPKILADIVESVAAAVYVDANFDLRKLWVIFRDLLEPIVTLADLQQVPQPVTMLFELCQKQGKQVDFKHWRNGSKSVASVYVDGTFVASGSSEQKEIAKLNAAKGALDKLLRVTDIRHVKYECLEGLDGDFEISGAKQKLYELCGKKKWPKPTYSIEDDSGSSHTGKKFKCSVKIATESGVLYMLGDEKPRVRDAENSAASLMIRALHESDYL